MSQLNKSAISPRLRFIFSILLALSIFPAQAPAKESKISSQISDVRHLLQTGILQTLAAKELCSCVYIAQVPLNICQARANIPSTALRTLRIDNDTEKKTISVSLSLLGYFLANEGGDDAMTQTFVKAKARFRTEQPQLGCQLIKTEETSPPSK